MTTYKDLPLPDRLRLDADEWDVSECPMRAATGYRAADEIDRLRQFIDSLDIVVTHPYMSGEHQCSIRANGRKLTREQWDIVLSTREASPDE